MDLELPMKGFSRFAKENLPQWIWTSRTLLCDKDDSTIEELEKYIKSRMVLLRNDAFIAEK